MEVETKSPRFNLCGCCCPTSEDSDQNETDLKQETVTKQPGQTKDLEDDANERTPLISSSQQDYTSVDPREPRPSSSLPESDLQGSETVPKAPDTSLDPLNATTTTPKKTETTPAALLDSPVKGPTPQDSPSDTGSPKSEKETTAADAQESKKGKDKGTEGTEHQGEETKPKEEDEEEENQAEDEVREEGETAQT